MAKIKYMTYQDIAGHYGVPNKLIKSERMKKYLFQIQHRTLPQESYAGIEAVDIFAAFEKLKQTVDLKEYSVTNIWHD